MDAIAEMDAITAKRRGCQVVIGDVGFLSSLRV
jgi:hypothetical protein